MINNLVGNRIREIRAKRNMTQQQLADLADIPRATLATIEKDESNPSLAAVYKISVALECAIDDLLEKQENRVKVIRNTDMVRVESVNGTYRATTVSPTSVHTYSQQLFTLQPNSVYVGKPHPPGSEEYLYILQGEVDLEVAEEEYHLCQGDSANFRGNVDHSYKNAGKIITQGIVTILEFPETG